MIIALVVTLYLLVALITFIGMSYWAYRENRDTSANSTGLVFFTSIVWPIGIPFVICMAAGFLALPLMFRLFDKVSGKK